MNIGMISTSEIKISVVIDLAKGEHASDTAPGLSGIRDPMTPLARARDVFRTEAAAHSGRLPPP